MTMRLVKLFRKSRFDRILIPLMTTFTGVGGIVFHVGHGPEHLICLIAGVGLAVSGACWGFYNNFMGPWLAHRRMLRRIGRNIPF